MSEWWEGVWAAVGVIAASSVIIGILVAQASMYREPDDEHEDVQ